MALPNQAQYEGLFGKRYTSADFTGVHHSDATRRANTTWDQNLALFGEYLDVAEALAPDPAGDAAVEAEKAIMMSQWETADANFTAYGLSPQAYYFARGQAASIRSGDLFKYSVLLAFKSLPVKDGNQGSDRQLPAIHEEFSTVLHSSGNVIAGVQTQAIDDGFYVSQPHPFLSPATLAKNDENKKSAQSDLTDEQKAELDEKIDSIFQPGQ